ncbi:D-alanine aminotransferase [Symmachiella dynata]|uniref:branched-chain-amino-acid transaminase n=1 Tax=Symmachiella dynata TaxID=2527995 RepID=A0A517ZW77_9PLAN|nr:aminotransferase class IV [Symmachiella dynata]QDU46731.1 D-alanine aminotransferase [Symmachiella dynata]
MSAEPIVYLNGEYLAASQASVSLADWGLHGVAVTEMTRTFGQRCFRLDDHLDRLNASADQLGIAVDLLRDDWHKITETVVNHHAALVGKTGELMVNHVISAGLNSMNAAPNHSGPTIYVRTFPLQFSRWAAKYQNGQHLVVPEMRQIPTECLNPRIKSRNRLHWYLADRQAREIDADASALLLDLQGHLTETSAGNVFIVREKTILTPRSEVTLGGISRMVVRDIAQFLGISYEEQNITLTEALSADEVFTSSTGYCVLPVTKIDGQPIGDGQPGAVYQHILETWNMMAGLDIAAQAVEQSVVESQ